jgi:membrane protein required for colicin V production
MNPFDAVVCVAAIVAIVIGFNVGLLRSLATILGYLLAAPLAVALAPRLTAFAFGRSGASVEQVWLVLFVVFVVAGIAASALLRIALSEVVGADIGLGDRLAGAVLGAVRTGLVAVLVVVVFDRVIPADRQPWYLIGSRLRPYLSMAGQKGVQSLPPEVNDYIDRLKREHGM